MEQNPVLIISSTNRKGANSFKIAEQYQSILREHDLPSGILDLELLPKDFVFSALYDNAKRNNEFNQLQKQVNEAAKIVFVIPEYNGSFPGVLKAFVDGLDYPHSFRHKKAALVGHSAGMQGSSLALSHFTDILNYLGMHVLAMKVRLPHIDHHIDEGKLSKQYEALLKEQASLFVNF